MMQGLEMTIVQDASDVKSEFCRLRHFDGKLILIPKSETHLISFYTQNVTGVTKI